MPPLPQRPVRPVNRAGPKPQPPSQSRQLMVVESCLKAEAKNFDDGSTGAGASSGEEQRSSDPPKPEPAPAPACEGGCCDDAPTSTYSCQQQAAWGKCGEAWMAGFCARSCGRCASSEDMAANATANATSSSNRRLLGGAMLV